MKRALLISVAALTAFSGTVASAQSRGHGRDDHDRGRQSRGHDQGHRSGGHDQGHRSDNHDQGHRRDSHDEGHRSRGHDDDRRRGGHDGGHSSRRGDDHRSGHSRWSRGQVYPHHHSHAHIVRDYGRYGWGRPPHGHAYYRAPTGEVVLAAIATGIILSVIGNGGGYGGGYAPYGY